MIHAVAEGLALSVATFHGRMHGAGESANGSVDQDLGEFVRQLAVCAFAGAACLFIKRISSAAREFYTRDVHSTKGNVHGAPLSTRCRLPARTNPEHRRRIMECSICLSVTDEEVRCHLCSKGHFFCVDCRGTHRDFCRAELTEHSYPSEPVVCDAAAAGCGWKGVRRDRGGHLANCGLSIRQRMVAPLEQKISQQQQCIEEQRQQMEQQQQRMEELFHLRYVNARLQARVGVEPKDLQRERQEERDYVTRMDTVAVQPGGAWMLINSKWLENWRKYAIELSTDDPPGPINNYCLVGRDFRPVHGLARVRDYRGMNQDVWHYFHERYGGGPAICRSEIDLYAPAKPLPPRPAY